MNIDHLKYLFTIIIFAGSVLLILWARDKRILRRYELVILPVVAISVPFAATDWFALRWHAWYYYSQNTLDIKFITELETYIFAAAITACVACATVVFATREDRLRKKRRHTKKQRKLKPRKLVPAAGLARR